MTQWPTVGVIFLTYAPDSDDGQKRSAIAHTSMSALRRGLRYSGTVRVHIADDGSERSSHVSSLVGVARRRWGGPTVTDSHRGGYGASYNLATQVVHGDAEVLLVLEDDWELTRMLDLDPLVATLVTAPPPDGDDIVRRIRCIRMGYLGQTKPIRGEVVTRAAGKMLVLDPASEERHIFAGGPRLETREFERDLGPWPEGLAAGWTEFEVSGRPASRDGVAWPLDYGPASQSDGSLFRHIGAVGLGELKPGAVAEG